MKTKQQLIAVFWTTLNQNDGYFLVFLNEKKQEKNLRLLLPFVKSG